ncbi:hypothetical protein SSCG_00352 [Streptomyces clavuligerus]|nr:hypothetical protein SSCG_00352 [Streptomyces clavuligerus]
MPLVLSPGTMSTAAARKTTSRPPRVTASISAEADRLETGLSAPVRGSHSAGEDGPVAPPRVCGRAAGGVDGHAPDVRHLLGRGQERCHQSCRLVPRLDGQRPAHRAPGPHRRGHHRTRR